MPVIRRTQKKRSPERLAVYREKCTADGIRFDSIPEREHYGKLVALQNAGRIKQLKVHPKFTFEIEGEKFGSYEADFSFVDCITNQHRIQDVKGWRMNKHGRQEPIVSPQYIYQKALMLLQFGLRVEEV